MFSLLPFADDIMAFLAAFLALFAVLALIGLVVNFSFLMPLGLADFVLPIGDSGKVMAAVVGEILLYIWFCNSATGNQQTWCGHAIPHDLVPLLCAHVRATKYLR